MTEIVELKDFIPAYTNAVQKLLEDDVLTRNEKIYSIADPLLSIWLDKHVKL